MVPKTLGGVGGLLGNGRVERQGEGAHFCQGASQGLFVGAVAQGVEALVHALCGEKGRDLLIFPAPQAEPCSSDNQRPATCLGLRGGSRLLSYG